MKRSRFLVMTAVLLLLSSTLLAQEQTASFHGTVMDQSGGALPGVSVEAVNQRGMRFSSVTDESGRYRFPTVPPGTYTVTATLAGMEPGVIRNLQIRLGTSPKVDVTLRVSAVTEAITVTAEAPIVDVTSSATATSMRSETFEKMPIGRDFTSVVALAAGATDTPKAGGISIDGASGSENVFVLDGVNVTDPEIGTSGKVIITDVVDEIQVKSAGYQAEYGGAIGGVVNVISKTGTNDFSGTVGGYFRDSSWAGDERPNLRISSTSSTEAEFVTYPKDDETRIEPGFTLGGPILRDRLWFFGGYEPLILDRERTVTFIDGTTDTFTQDFRRDNAALTLSGTAGSRFIYKFSGNNSGGEQENLLPAKHGRVTSAQSDYTGRIDEYTNWTASAYGDFVVNQDLALSLRGGRFVSDLNQSGYPSDPYVWFWRGSSGDVPGIDPSLVRPNGFRSAPTPSSTVRNQYTRDNMYFDTAWFPNFAGSHAIKAGVQIENLENDVLEGFTNYVIRTAWMRTTPWWGSDDSGPYGQAGVYVFQTTGLVESKNTALFLQDSWTTMNDRLTLNVGVRAEKEEVPNYADPSLGLPGVAINFDYDDKIAPRLGFAYDLRGDGRWKTYGSYGTFYDITKMEMPRGSFGGDKWIWFNFAINDPDWTKWQCTGVGTNQAAPPTCTGMSYIGSIDLRHPSLELIEPNLKPMESREYTLGLEHQLSDRMMVGARYVHKELVRTIEDVGVLVTDTDGSQHEEYFIANPGEGIATHILGTQFPAFPKPKRDYDALELTFSRRFSDRWGLNANYVYSRLYGNYAGLANSDELLYAGGLARRSPNVSRYGDSLFAMFDASGSGQAVEGRLATDQPHQFKAQFVYGFDFGLTTAINQYVGSGTPVSTQFYVHGVEFFPYGRGDMGRTDTMTQTDLALQYQIPLMGQYNLELGLNILNLFDEENSIAVYNWFSDTSVEVSDEEFFSGFDPMAVIGDVSQNRDPQYGLPWAFQDPREVRLHVKLRF